MYPECTEFGIKFMRCFFYRSYTCQFFATTEIFDWDKNRSLISLRPNSKKSILVNKLKAQKVLDTKRIPFTFKVDVSP